MKVWVISIIVIGLIFGCSKKTTEKEVLVEQYDSITRVDTAAWVGVYTGIVPNSTDIGLEMKLSLNPSNTYDIVITNLTSNPKDNIRREYSGQIHWDEDSTTIELREIDSISNKFKIRPGQVDYLNPDATPNTGKLAEFYVLKKK